MCWDQVRLLRFVAELQANYWKRGTERVCGLEHRITLFGKLVRMLPAGE